MRYFCSFLLFLSFNSIAQQVVFVKKDATGLGNGTSWANAYANLSIALKNAPSNAEFWVAKGTYTPTAPDTTYLITKGVSLLGGFAGTETNKASRNVANNLTILSGEGATTANSDNFSIVLKIYSPQDSVIVDGFKITKTQHKSYYAGSVKATRTKMRFSNCIFQNDVPAEIGGASFYADSGSIYLSKVSFVNNASLYPMLLNMNHNTLSLNDCLFENNSSTGLGIANINNTGLPLNCANTTFRNNSKAELHILASYARFKSCIFENHEVNSSYLVYVSGADSLILDKCQFLNNKTKSPLVYGNEMIIRNSTFLNGADNAIYQSGGKMRVSNTSFEGFGGGSGGAIYCNEGIFDQCTFTKNKSGIGGALYSQKISISNSSFLNNSAGRGIAGAVYTSGSFDIKKSIFKNNIGAQGGAIIGAKGSVFDSYFENNVAWYSGGAINSFDSTTIENSTFIKNGTPDTSTSKPYSSGGAIYCGGRTTIYNSLFLGNSAYNGAAVQAGGASAFVNTTFKDNKSPVDSSNGTFSHVDSVQLANCIFWDQTDKEFYTDYASKEYVNYSIIKGGAIGTANSQIDPLLDANGVPLPSSPAINKGSITKYWQPKPYDLAGNPRIIGTIDIGAFEFQGTVTSIDFWADKSGFSIYPNPVSSESNLSIQLENSSDYSQAELYTTLGTAVARVPLEDSITTVPFNGLTVGCYVLVLTKPTGERVVTKIMVK